MTAAYERTTKQRLQFIQEGALVERFHTRTGIKPETDGQHQYMVAMLCYMLSPTIPSAHLLMAALTHDLAEQYAGDVPAPTKWAMNLSDQWAATEDTVLQKYGLLFALDDVEERLLSYADAMAGMLYCCNEAALGSKKCSLAYKKWEERMCTCVLTEREAEIFNAIQQMWKESNEPQGPQYDVFERP